MKKLLSFLAAGIAALGLASCSGDLHNEFDPTSELAKALFDTSINISEFKTFELVGDMQGWDNANGIVFYANDDGTWETDFVAPDAENMTFAFITNKGSWDGQIGGDKIEADSLPEGVEYEAKDNGFGGFNGNLIGLKAGTTYKMIVDASTGVYVISVEKSIASPFYLNGYFILTSENGGAADPSNVLIVSSVNKKTAEVTYKYDFTFDATSNTGMTVTDPTTQVAFLLVQGTDSKGYGKATYAIGAEEAVKATADTDVANVITGLENGKKYRITITTTSDKAVSISAEKAVSMTVTGATVSATDLPDELNGATLYFTGSFNGWTKPGLAGTIEATVADGKVQITLPDFVGDFYAGDDPEFKVDGKFASAGWATPEIVEASTYDNITFTITDSKKTVKGTYKSKKDEGAGKYGCEWTVE